MSQADVVYSCRSCGYPLNLESSNRVTSGIGSEHQKSLKKGLISFISVDLSRFTQVDEVKCFPISWGRHRSKTKLLCRKCGAFIGYGYGESPVLCSFDPASSSSSTCEKYSMKIHALQPSEQIDSGLETLEQTSEQIDSGLETLEQTSSDLQTSEQSSSGLQTSEQTSSSLHQSEQTGSS